MGGNALKMFDITPCRLLAVDFHALESVVLGEFSRQFPGVRIASIPSYGQKKDFGDLDLLVSREAFVAAGGVDALDEWCERVGYSRGQNRNGPVISVEWRSSPTQKNGFQVDFITTPSAEFDTALHYYSFNDLGNLIGRIAHKMGLTHGHQGLLLPLRDGTHQFEKILVSSNPDKTLQFLGYSPERFNRGFDNLEDIFEYVASSGYFNKDIYLLENRNHASRVRDQKRKTYRDFLTWVQTRDDLPQFEFPEDKSSWLSHVFSFFPGSEEKYAQSWENLQKQRKLRELFNGDNVGQLSGLSGKELGILMSKMKHTLGSDRIEKLLADGGLEALRPAISEIVLEMNSKIRSSPGR